MLKEKKSKFYGYAFYISKTEEVTKYLTKLKKKHHSAGHFCYAYQIGIEDKSYRFNDDGEPRNSAGAPIYGQIKAFGLTNILIVVVRYFGGTKLGVGGLISAYKECAKKTLENNTELSFYTGMFDFSDEGAKSKLFGIRSAAGIGSMIVSILGLSLNTRL